MFVGGECYVCMWHVEALLSIDWVLGSVVFVCVWVGPMVDALHWTD